MDFVCTKCGGTASQVVPGVDGQLYLQCAHCGDLTPIERPADPTEKSVGETRGEDRMLSRGS